MASISSAPAPNKTTLRDRFDADQDVLHVPPVTIKAVGYLDALFPELSGKAGRNLKAVMLALLGYVGNDWRAFPSQATIAEQAGISRSSVQRALLTIERLGIAKPVRDRDSQGRFDEIEFEVCEPVLRRAYVAGEKRREERVTLRNEARSAHRHVASVTHHRASNLRLPCFKTRATVLHADAQSVPSEAPHSEATQPVSSQSSDGLFSHLEEKERPTSSTRRASGRAGRTDPIAALIDRIYDFDQSTTAVRATRRRYHERERSHIEFRLSRGITLEQIWTEATRAA